MPRVPPAFLAAGLLILFPTLVFSIILKQVLFDFIIHLAVTLGVFAVALRWRFSLQGAFLAGLLFAIHPAKAEVLLDLPMQVPASVICWAWALAGGVKQWIFPMDLSLVHPVPFSLAGMAHLSPSSAVVMGLGKIMYLPSIIFSLAVAAGIMRVHHFLIKQEEIIRYLFISGVVVLLGGLMVLSYAQASLAMDPLRLWEYQARVRPHPVVFDRLANVYRAQPEYQKAQEYAQKNVTPDKDIAAFQQRVEQTYLNAVNRDPRYADGHYDLATFYEDLRRLPDAAIWYEKTIAIDPSRQEAHFALGRVYHDMGKPQEVITVFNRLLEHFPDDENVMAKVIDAYNAASEQDPVYREKREDVLATYAQLTKRKKYGAVDFFNLGFLYEQVGGREEAMRFYRKALELKPKYDKPLFQLAGLYKEAGDLKTAMALYERLVHARPEFAPAYLNMGIIYNALGDAEKARSLYQKTVALDPGNATGYFNLGYLSEAKGELKEAVAFYEKAVEADPKYAEAYYNMGNVYAVLLQYPEAIAAYLKTVAIDPNHQNAYVNLSILSFKSHDFQGAIRYLEEARLLGYNPPEGYLKSLEPYKTKK